MEVLSKFCFFLWLSAITIASLIDYSSVAGLDFAKKGFGSGFWLHLAGYFVAGVLFFFAFGKARNKRLLLALIALFLLGFAFELLQIPIPKRSFNPNDVLANGLGLAGFYIWYKFRLTRE